MRHIHITQIKDDIVRMEDACELSIWMDIPESTNMTYDVTVTCSGTSGRINAQL